ncbi:MAG: tRNA (uridine(34)/cytosine(34)/5-carboxymethylaminomethyluridine(34)-2'-O)-methyltransferase TrmL [Candidatus Aminicenantes bacterium]|jgi:tRNA (cytidine/uridine-2'-O-)-methyltransferase
MLHINIVLHEPEIPQNTGNISRISMATGAKLHLIKPLGFSVDDKHLKRAGLDYWNRVNVAYYESFDEFLKINSPTDLFLFTKKATQSYDIINFSGNVFLVFGKETYGLHEEILEEFKARCYRIPMRREARSLNLANAVAVVVFEALRQNGYPDLELTGNRLQNQYEEQKGNQKK